MEADFQTVIIRVLIAGIGITAAGVAVLFFAFRAFGAEEPRQRHIMLLAALGAFVLLCCAGLFIVSRLE